MLDTGNEHDVGVEPYEAWCSALRALEWENPDSIPAVGSALSVTGYMPFSPALRRLGDALVMDEFFQNYNTRYVIYLPESAIHVMLWN